MNAWEAVWTAISTDLGDVFDATRAAQLIVRMVFAALLGGVVGFDRERRGKEAGLRTHMLVALGAALFVIVPQQAGMTDAELSRVIQGVAAGIGFIGGGAILKLSEQGQVKGLTTAAGIWVTAALGLAAGYGRIGTAVLATLLGIGILTVLGWYERDIVPPAAPDSPPEPPANDKSAP
jgi:putative Mg2+ transporter-C (MgtC) family protein